MSYSSEDEDENAMLERALTESYNNEYNRVYNEAYTQAYNQVYNEAVHGESSVPRRRAFIERDREQGQKQLWQDYFCDTPTYPPEMFRRRFRMNKNLFLRIANKLTTDVRYFSQRANCHGRMGLTGLQKCTAAIRMLAYGGAADMNDEYLRIGESTTLEALEEFSNGVIALFGEEYLRRPTAEDLQRLLDVGQARGFPGMLGSIDCMHWQWKNCPTAWKGQYTRGSKKPTIVLEAVASQDLWIWHAFFGLPGTLNDINVLDRSPLFDDLIYGRAPKVSFTVNNHNYKMGYYLTDGIYPKWSTFIQSIPLPQGPKAQLFAKCQEAVRKDVERAFGVLQARFAIIKHPIRHWHKEKIGRIMRCCVILHNMIVEDERDGYSLTNTSEFVTGESSRSSQVDLSFTSDNPSTVGQRMLATRTEMRDAVINHRLQTDLVENIWQMFGDDDELDD